MMAENKFYDTPGDEADDLLKDIEPVPWVDAPGDVSHTVWGLTDLRLKWHGAT